MANRKLQGEIERCLKKVSEGIEIFEELYDKIYQTTNQSQKEKIETELKKEIKKLQRLRDNIKTWLGSNEIKDKKQLTDARKLIEAQMEKFKACEREMKTKQYSKEGLLAKDKVDPAEEKKIESAGWITGMVDKLNTQAEAEQIKAAKGRRGVKVDNERLQEIEHFLERHKFHMAKLEAMLRNLENDQISVEDVEGVKDMIEYYIDSNQEPDFIDDEEIYDSLNLVDDEHVGVLEEHNPHATTSEKGSNPTSGVNTALGSQESVASNGTTNGQQQQQQEDSVVNHKKEDVVKKETVKKEEKKETKKVQPVELKEKKAALPPVAPVTKPTIKYAAVIQQAQTTQQTAPSEKLPLAKVVKLPPPQPVTNISTSTVVVEEQQPKSAAVTLISTTPATSADTTTTAAVTPIVNEVLSPSTPATSATEEKQHLNHLNSDFYKRYPKSFSDLISTYESNRKRVYGNGDDCLRNQYLIHLLMNSFQQCPDITDSERNLNTPINNNPNLKIPDYYPKQSLNLTSPAMFERLDLDTLFFIFYYQQNTKAQFLAARELKRQSWRFHKKYMTWFQRHEEPRSITDEYEQGTYVYFDFEGTWCQRKKSEFTFEYRYLEGE